VTRSHPPTLITIAKRTIVRERLFARGDVVLVAVSGGRDSMALLHVLALLRRTLGHRVVAHGVDHGLRSDAAAELDRAGAYAAALDVPFERTCVVVAPGGDLQARARAARHAALDAAARRHNASCVAFAHHADDRAETLLLRLLRGTSPRGLAVMPPRAEGAGGVDRVRPFVEAPRASIDLHVARHAIDFADDPSNRDPRFLRTRVRHELMPVLLALSPRIVESLTSLAAESAAAWGPPLAPKDMAGALAPEPGAARGDPAELAAAFAALAGGASRPYPLPRATRAALRDLTAPLDKTGANWRTARSKVRIQLPGGLVATKDRTQVQVLSEGTTWARRRQ